MFIKKKVILLLADSVVDLRFVYEILSRKYRVIWVFYHKKNIKQAKKLGITGKSIIYLKNKNSLFFLRKIFDFFLSKFNKYLKFNYDEELLNNIKNIDLKIQPDLWITDTGGILSRVKIKNIKATFKHSVPYKKFFLSENIFDYDYVFIPGHYHLQRILNFYEDKKKQLKKKLIIAPSPKIMPYIKLNNNFLSKTEFFKKYSLDINKGIVVLATTHNAFQNKRFLPENFGSEVEALEEIARKIISNEFNFIIKLHHYHYYKFLDDKFSFLKKIKNLHVFQTNKNFDSLDSEEVFFYSDIIITDTSGVGPIGCYLNKKMIYLNPDPPFDWDSSDIEKKMRPGFIIKKKEDINEALVKYKAMPTLFDKDRKDFTNSIFGCQTEQSLSVIENKVDKMLS